MSAKEEILKSLAETAAADLYNNKYVNRTGMVDGVRVSELVAEFLLDNLHMLSNIQQITREKDGRSYKTPNREEKKEEVRHENSKRNEEWTAKDLYHAEIEGLGKILDYQTPLKNERKDRAGKVDMLSFDKASNTVYLLELKAPNSDETLLRCVLEIFTYGEIVDTEKLLADFSTPEMDLTNTEVKKAVLVYESCKAYADFDTCQNARKLMEKLGVAFFVLAADNTKANKR